MQTKTFRGLSLAEVEGQVRADLGDDAVIVRSREGLTGGVGGFFQRRIFEVEAVAGNGAPAPAAEAAEAAAPAVEPQPIAMPAPVTAPVAEEPHDFLTSLRAALGPELEQAAAEQRAAHAAADFVPDALAAAARVEQAAAAPEPEPEPEFMPTPMVAPAPANGASALAALFAPDVPRAPVAWPGEPAPEPAPLVPEPVVIAEP